MGRCNFHRAWPHLRPCPAAKSGGYAAGPKGCKADLPLACQRGGVDALGRQGEYLGDFFGNGTDSLLALTTACGETATITGAQSGLRLDVTGASTANGALVELWSRNGGGNQRRALG
jgi:hypothetical protein